MEDCALPGGERLWRTAGDLLQLLGKEINVIKLIGHVPRYVEVMKASSFRGVALKQVKMCT